MRLYLVLAAAFPLTAAPARAAPDAAAPAHAASEAPEPPAPLRPTSPTAETYALARSLAGSEESVVDTAVAAMSSLTKLFGTPADASDEAMLRAVLQESRAELQQATDAAIEIYARNYTDEELRAGIAFLQDPLLKSVARKQRVFGPEREDLTAQEAAALKAWKESDAGRSIETKKRRVAMLTMAAAMEPLYRISERFQARLCAEKGCPAPKWGAWKRERSKASDRPD